jgi:hypothetical protein
MGGRVGRKDAGDRRGGGVFSSASVDQLVEDNPAAHAHAEAGRAMKTIDLPMRPGEGEYQVFGAALSASQSFNSER